MHKIMLKIRYKYVPVFAGILLLLSLSVRKGYAQNNGKSKENTAKNKKITLVNIASTIVDENAHPIEGATVLVGEGLLEVSTDKSGNFELKAPTDATLIIQALGYSEITVNLKNEAVPNKIVLKKQLIYTSASDLVEMPLNLTTSKRELVGAISKINGSDLSKYPDLSLSNTLQGKLMGLYVESTSNGLGNNSSNLYVRGLNRGGADNALTLVDGIERPLNFINPEEIESVEVIKDPSSKILYGPRAANGLVLITTKRGLANTKVLKVSAEFGINNATRLPKYLDSYQYAQLYNEARQNDGFTPFYSDSTLLGYKNSTGPNDLKYPNVDYYDYFLFKSTPVKKVNIDYSGGTDKSAYSLIIGYTGAQGFEKIGETPTQDRINIRGNLDFQISPNFKAFVDASGIVERRLWSGFNQDQVFNILSSYRPNEFPLYINDPNLLSQSTPVGLSYVPPLGGSFLRPVNLAGELIYGGNTQHNYFYGQTNFGLDFNLQKIIKGFTLKTVLNFDNYQFFQSGRNLVPVTYAAEETTNNLGEVSTVYVPLQKRITADYDSRQGQDISRNYGFNATLGYHHQFSNSDLRGSLTQFYYKYENQGSYQAIENSNSVLSLNYGIKNKIYFNGSIALMGSNKFIASHQYDLFPAGGFAWVLSDEGFLKKSKTINYLKFKADFGILGYDRSTDYYLFQSRWYNNGSVTSGEPQNVLNTPRTSLDLVGNPNLGWEKSREVNIGLEGVVVKNKVSFEFNYFNNLRSDIIINPSYDYSSLAGGLYPRLNQGKTTNKGFEGEISWLNHIGNVHLTIGGNFTYAKNKIEQNSDVMNLDPALNTIGQPSDVIFGYVAKGLFKSASEVNSSPIQTMGPYGVGDIQYADLNGDNVIDARDRQVIGNSFPRVIAGINVNLKYKRFGIYVLGTSEMGVNNILNNSYYRNNGEGKYSVLALDRYHPTNNPNGIYPRLTTLSAANNNVNSTFWIQNANFFRLKNVELSYSVDKRTSSLRNYTFYLRGTNLLVLSKNKDLDPEVINAGVTNYPIYRTFTVGASVKF